MESPPPLGISKNRRIITSLEEFGSDTIEWMSAEGEEPIFRIMALSYRAIQQHLQKLLKDPEMNWENPKIESGIASIMATVGESAEKLDAYLALRLDEPLKEGISDLKELKALQRFYTREFAPKFTGEPPILSEEDEEELLDDTEVGLKDFETVKRDLEYELFYIRKDDGEPFYDKAVLRNIRLSCNFDLGGEILEEDPLLKVRAMQDKDLQQDYFAELQYLLKN